METEKHESFKFWGKRIGYFSSYLLFTTVMGGIMFYLNKIPSGWSYFHLVGLTLLIVSIGMIIKRWLK